MATSVGVGYSFHRNPREAGQEAVRKAMTQAGQDDPDFVFVFATVGYDQQLLIESINHATKNAPLSGCSGEGIITQEMSSETNFGVAVMVVKSDELRFRNSCVTGVEGSLDVAGDELAAAMKPHLASEPIASLIFADGLIFNFDIFMNSFEKAVGNGQKMSVLGGMAADNWATSKTYQYHNDRVISGGISGVAVSGKGEIISGVHHGCTPVGSRHIVTRSKGNVIYEIDGIPALDAMKDFFEADWQSNWNRTSINLCIGFKTPENIFNHYEEFIVRYMIAKNDVENSVIIQSDVREGSEMWMVRRDDESIVAGLRNLSRRMRDELGGRIPKFIMQFECAGRGKVFLREKVKVELISSLQREMGGDIPWIGFYGYGEIGPVAGHNCFHNFTSVVTAFY